MLSTLERPSNFGIAIGSTLKFLVIGGPFFEVALLNFIQVGRKLKLSLPKVFEHPVFRVKY